MATVSELLHAIELVDNALALVDMALNRNPSKDEERSLRRQSQRLETERFELEADLDALLAGTVAPGPSTVQFEQIAALSVQVECATNQRVAASAAITLAGRALSFAIDISTA